jgi:uncharacterized protein DUF5666
LRLIREEVLSMLNHRWASVVVFTFGLASTIGCTSTSSISAPSSLPSTAGNGATIIGTFSDSSSSAQGVAPASAASPTVTVTVVGTNISATVGRGESFTLNGVPSGDVVLQISSAGGISAQVTIPAVQNQEQIRVTVRVNGSGATIAISERSMPVNSEARVAGPITSINATALTLIVDGVTVSAPAGTVIQDDKDRMIAFSSLKTGERVTVTGTFSGPTLVASKIAVNF